MYVETMRAISGAWWACSIPDAVATHMSCLTGSQARARMGRGKAYARRGSRNSNGRPRSTGKTPAHHPAGRGGKREEVGDETVTMVVVELEVVLNGSCAIRGGGARIILKRKSERAQHLRS
ncbi:hypothetical protein FGB62_72g09 [Gracilaria domingensis]|nr:hypothetical protein FGB62_72g09 [Gracilaria domingensis]